MELLQVRQSPLKLNLFEETFTQASITRHQWALNAVFYIKTLDIIIITVSSTVGLLTISELIFWLFVVYLHFTR